MEAFLRRVLPDGGDYVVMIIDPRRAGPPQHVNGLKTIGSVVNAVQRLSQQPVNVYFAVGTYGADRKAPLAKRCLFLDLDSKDFGSKQEAAKQLGVFIKTIGMPPPSIVVDSGGGLHCYWPFDKDLPVAEWKPIASALKAKCKEHDFAADPACTDDVARVLRMPTTMNQKFSPALPCRILHDNGKSFDPIALGFLLNPAPSGAAAILAGSVGDDLSSGGAAIPNVPYYGAEIAEKCGVMKEALETGGANHIEPLWSNLLSLLAFCEDGATMAHRISDGHQSYDEKKCSEKFEYKLKRRADGTLKPVLCSTFATYSSACAECPFNGKIKTPITLGKQEAVSFLPFGYIMKPNGVFKVKKAAEPDMPDTHVMAFPYTISDVDLLSTGAGYMVKATYSSKHNLIRTEMPLILFADQGAELSKTLMQAGVIAGNFFINELKHIMTHWLKRLQDIKEATRSNATNMGWGTRNGEAVFAAGPKIYHRDGKTDTFTHPETQLLRDYDVEGKRTAWDTAANMVLSDGRQAIAAAVLTAFSAPLMLFTGAAGITFSLCSAASGTGKSTALKLAQGVWAHPVRAMAMLDDTPNSVAKKLGFINNLPAYWDEVRLTDNFDSFIKMIFQLGQGKEKARLTSSVRQQDMGTWKTMIVMATNERIVDHVDAIVRASNAGRLRVFEVTVPNPQGPADPKIQRAVDKLEHHHGHVGQQYARFLVANKEKVEALVHAVLDKTSKDLTATPDERFWTAFVACQLVAAMLVTQIGILNVDIERLRKWLYAEFLSQRMGVNRNYLPPNEAAIGSVLQYADVHREQIVVTEFAGGKRGYGALLAQPMTKEILVLLAKNDKILRVKEAHFKEWVHRVRHQSPTVIINELQKLGVVTMRKASVTAGIVNTTSARMNCLDIDLSNGLFASLLEDQ